MCLATKIQAHLFWYNAVDPIDNLFRMRPYLTERLCWFIANFFPYSFVSYSPLLSTP